MYYQQFRYVVILLDPLPLIVKKLKKHVTRKQWLFKTYGLSTVFVNRRVAGESDEHGFPLAVMFQLLFFARTGMRHEPFQVLHPSIMPSPEAARKVETESNLCRKRIGMMPCWARIGGNWRRQALNAPAPYFLMGHQIRRNEFYNRLF
jgi:hypothetical protein